MLSHCGSSIGFDSQLAVWPEAELGTVVLTNAQRAELVAQGVQFRMAELLFDQPAEIEEPVTQGNAAFARSAAALGSQLGDQVDPTVAGRTSSATTTRCLAGFHLS